MSYAKNQITSDELLNHVIPKLKTLNFVLKRKLSHVIKESETPAEREKYKNYEHELELNVMMIQMNIDHLLLRYADVLGDNNRGMDNRYLTLDDNERMAISTLMSLYNKVSELVRTL